MKYKTGIILILAVLIIINITPICYSKYLFEDIQKAAEIKIKSK